ncbi:hypothetical protein QQ045_032239 [Rhodiola kirilowii]
MSVIVFKCRWVNTDPTERGNIKIDLGLISVDTSISWYEDSRFRLASTARQVFYIDDPKAGDNWKVFNTSLRGTYEYSSLAHVEDDVQSSRLSREDNAYQEQGNMYICNAGLFVARVRVKRVYTLQGYNGLRVTRV